MMLKNLITILALVLTGLSAGLFVGWSVSVIPGTRLLKDIDYLHAMQQINRAILNPFFFSIFFGAAMALVVQALSQWGQGWWLMAWLSVALIYVVGCIGVTGLGNVPLNDLLDAKDLSLLSDAEIQSFRSLYETKWNRLHQIRTMGALVPFILAVCLTIYQMLSGRFVAVN